MAICARESVLVFLCGSCRFFNFFFWGGGGAGECGSGADDHQLIFVYGLMITHYTLIQVHTKSQTNILILWDNRPEGRWGGGYYIGYHLWEANVALTTVSNVRVGRAL